jgi:hypothetical protein
LPRVTRSTRSRRYAEDIPEITLVEEIVIDPKFGTLAPRAEVVEEEEQLSVVGQLLRDFDRQDREAAEAAATAESAALAASRPVLEPASEAPQNPHQTEAILPTIQASEAPREANETAKDDPPPPCVPFHRRAESLRQKKSAKKLTRNKQIAIVRGFREYPGRAIRETRCAEGWRKAQAN